MELLLLGLLLPPLQGSEADLLLLLNRSDALLLLTAFKLLQFTFNLLVVLLGLFSELLQCL